MYVQQRQEQQRDGIVTLNGLFASKTLIFGIESERARMIFVHYDKDIKKAHSKSQCHLAVAPAVVERTLIELLSDLQSSDDEVEIIEPPRKKQKKRQWCLAIH